MDADDLAWSGLARQAELVAAGEVSPAELLDVALARIERLDPDLNAFRRVFADEARAAAREAEERRARGDDAPLLGVPVALKDNVDVAGHVTTQGTDANHTPARDDAEVVR